MGYCEECSRPMAGMPIYPGLICVWCYRDELELEDN